MNNLFEVNEKIFNTNALTIFINKKLLLKTAKSWFSHAGKKVEIKVTTRDYDNRLVVMNDNYTVYVEQHEDKFFIKRDDLSYQYRLSIPIINTSFNELMSYVDRYLNGEKLKVKEHNPIINMARKNNIEIDEDIKKTKLNLSISNMELENKPWYTNKKIRNIIEFYNLPTSNWYGKSKIIKQICLYYIKKGFKITSHSIWSEIRINFNKTKGSYQKNLNVSQKEIDNIMTEIEAKEKINYEQFIIKYFFEKKEV